MPLSVGAPRLLLRRLREVMAERESAQARLDKVVVLIASNMVAEVCSLYLRRRDSSLELFATEGLNPEAVHNTHLKAGEGLVGLIAEHGEPMQFDDAQVHYSYEEVEALQTTAMVIAEMIASGCLVVSEEGGQEARREQSARVTGVTISEGVALGHVVLHEP